jgi:hypothetical protein
MATGLYMLPLPWAIGCLVVILALGIFWVQHLLSNPRINNALEPQVPIQFNVDPIGDEPTWLGLPKSYQCQPTALEIFPHDTLPLEVNSIIQSFVCAIQNGAIKTDTESTLQEGYHQWLTAYLSANGSTAVESSPPKKDVGKITFNLPDDPMFNVEGLNGSWISIALVLPHHPNYKQNLPDTACGLSPLGLLPKGLFKLKFQGQDTNSSIQVQLEGCCP